MSSRDFLRSARQGVQQAPLAVCGSPLWVTCDLCDCDLSGLGGRKTESVLSPNVFLQKQPLHSRAPAPPPLCLPTPAPGRLPRGRLLFGGRGSYCRVPVPYLTGHAAFLKAARQPDATCLGVS